MSAAMAKAKQPRSGKKGKPHDAVFKAFFSDAKIVQNYLLHYSPPATRLTTGAPARLIFLFEHKSYITDHYF